MVRAAAAATAVLGRRLHRSGLPSFANAARARCALPAHAARGLSTGSFASALPPGLAGGVGGLSDIAKVPLLMQESPARVREIWLERHRETGDALGGALSADEYKKLRQNADACPMFLVPVRRGDGGYINFVWQAQRHKFLVKTLEAFQQGSQHVDLSITFFEELLSSHQLVLLQGKVHSNALLKEDAERIIRYLREAYADEARFRWVERFNLRPREFDYDEFVKEFRPLEAAAPSSNRA